MSKSILASALACTVALPLHAQNQPETFAQPRLNGVIEQFPFIAKQPDPLADFFSDQPTIAAQIERDFQPDMLIIQTPGDLGAFARSPSTPDLVNRVDLDAIAQFIEPSDPLGAALTYQAAGSDEWQRIVAETDLSQYLNAQTTLEQQDLPTIVGLMSQAARADVATPFQDFTLNLDQQETIWRVDGIDIPIPLAQAPVGEVMARANGADLPALLNTYDVQTADEWSGLFNQMPAAQFNNDTASWDDLASGAVSSGGYVALDQYLANDYVVRDALKLDFTPQTRLKNLLASDLSSQQQTQLGDVYLDLDNVTEANSSFRNALNYDPTNVGAIIGLAQTDLLIGDTPFVGAPQDAADVLRRYHEDGDTRASLAILSSPSLEFTPSEVIEIASQVLQAPPTPEAESIARTAQHTGCRAIAKDDETQIVCQFFPIVYVTTRAPMLGLADRLDFGTTAATNNQLSFGILRNDVVMEARIPDGSASLAARGACVGLSFCYQNDVLRADAAADVDGLSAIMLLHNGILADALGDIDSQFENVSKDSERAIILIHGFNTDFSQAVDALTNLMVTARYPATPYLLSWPSQGRLIFDGKITEGKIRVGLDATYETDRGSVTESCTTMRNALFDILSHYEDGQVDLVVHSMGNQLLYEIMNGCGTGATSDNTPTTPPIRNLILSSPDVGLPNFEASTGLYAAYANRTFIYGTTEDLVLSVSSRLNDKIGDVFGARLPRAGLFGGPHFAADHIQWINTATVDHFSAYAPANHSHYVNTPAVRRDIALVLMGFGENEDIRCVIPTDGTQSFYYVSPNCL